MTRCGMVRQKYGQFNFNIWTFINSNREMIPKPLPSQYLVYRSGSHIPVFVIVMNALGLMSASSRLRSALKSSKVGSRGPPRRLISKSPYRRVTLPSSYTSTSVRPLFGFSFAPKQKESAPTDGLSSYGMDKMRPRSEDNSDNFSKNPMYLTKSDAKDEYGFNRVTTNVGTKLPF